MTMIIDGTNGLTFNNATTQASAGCVLQVVSTTKTDTASNTSSTMNDITGMSVTITPKFSTSNILVFFSAHLGNLGGNTEIGIRLMRGSTAICVGDTSGSRTPASGSVYNASGSMQDTNGHYLDSPATTSATTYKLQWMSFNGSTNYINRSTGDGDATSTWRQASTITVMEIAG